MQRFKCLLHRLKLRHGWWSFSIEASFPLQVYWASMTSSQLVEKKAKRKISIRYPFQKTKISISQWCNRSKFPISPTYIIISRFHVVLKRVGEFAARQRRKKLRVICPKLLEFIGDALNMVPAFTVVVVVVVVVLGGLVSLGFSHGSQIHLECHGMSYWVSSPFRDSSGKWRFLRIPGCLRNEGPLRWSLLMWWWWWWAH